MKNNEMRRSDEQPFVIQSQKKKGQGLDGSCSGGSSGSTGACSGGSCASGSGGGECAYMPLVNVESENR